MVIECKSSVKKYIFKEFCMIGLVWKYEEGGCYKLDFDRCL